MIDTHSTVPALMWSIFIQRIMKARDTKIKDLHDWPSVRQSHLDCSFAEQNVNNASICNRFHQYGFYTCMGMIHNEWCWRPQHNFVRATPHEIWMSKILSPQSCDHCKRGRLAYRSLSIWIHPIKCAHGFVALCFVVFINSILMGFM